MIAFFVIAATLSVASVVIIALPLLRRDAAAPGSKGRRFAALVALGAAPLVAGAIYLQVGAPQAFDPAVSEAAPTPIDEASIAAMAPEERAAMIEEMVESLAARLQVNPDDLAGWRMLARSYGVLQRHEDAADAWREALVLSEGAVEDWRGLALALIQERNPETAPAVKEAFEEVLLQAPEDPLALYFLGHAAQANGNTARARSLWTRLRAQAPEGSDQRAELDALLTGLPEE